MHTFFQYPKMLLKCGNLLLQENVVAIRDQHTRRQHTILLSYRKQRVCFPLYGGCGRNDYPLHRHRSSLAQLWLEDAKLLDFGFLNICAGSGIYLVTKGSYNSLGPTLPELVLSLSFPL